MQFQLFASYIDHFHRDAALFCGEALHKEGITLGLLYFILYVCKNPGCTPIQMTRDLGLDRAYVIRCVQKLVGDGFFVRSPHPTDGRATVLYATEKASRLFQRSQKMLEDWDKRTLEGITEEETEELFYLLEKIQKKGK